MGAWLALPARRIGNPPFFEHLYSKVPVRRVITEGHVFKERDNHSFLFRCERSESWRLPIRRPQIMEQSFNRHLRIVHVSERVADKVGRVVSPRIRIEISKAPESVCLKVRVCQFVENRGRWWCKVIAVHCIGTAQCHPRGVQRMGMERLAGFAADLRTFSFFFHGMANAGADG